MTLRNLMARINGSPDSPQDAELRRLSEAGDVARRERQPELALGYYQHGLELARQHNTLPGEEYFLGLIGELQTERTRYEEAESALTDAITIAERLNDMTRRARALGNLGVHYFRRGMIVKAQNVLEQALELARLSTDGPVIALTLANLGNVYLKQNNTTYAIRLLEEGAARWQAIPSSPIQYAAQVAYTVGLLGQARVLTNDTDRGYKLINQAIGFARQSGNADQELLWSNALAEALFTHATYPEALDLYKRCETLAIKVAQPPAEYMQHHLLNRATIHARLNQNEIALGYATQALTQAREALDRPAEARTLTLLADIYKALHNMPEAIASIQAASALYNGTVDNTEERVNALLTLGTLQQSNGDAAQAMQTFDEALTLTDDQTEVGGLGRARALRRIGNTLNEQGQSAQALERWTEALGLFERNGQPGAAARLLCDIGTAHRAIGGVNAALPDYERATMLLSTVRDPATRGLVLSNVANLYTDLGEIETAASFYQESIQLARQLAERRTESLRLGNYGWFFVATGQPSQAIKLLEEALTLSRTLNDPLLTAVQTSNLGQAYLSQRDYQKAQDLFQQSIVTAEKLNETRWLAIFRSNLGRTLAAQNQPDAALALYEQALPVSRQLNDLDNVARTLARMADLHLKRAQFVEADSEAREAEAIARKWGYRKGQADALLVRSGVARAQNDMGNADKWLAEAVRLYGILHDPLAIELAPPQAV